MRAPRALIAGSRNSVQGYLREIKDESLLTPAEECALAEAIALGDSAANSDDSGQPAARRQDRG